MKTNVKTMLKALFLILVIGSFMTACNKKDDQAKVAVQLTDDPFPMGFVAEANIQVTKIELKNTDGSYVTVFEGSKTVNMVDYTNGSTTEVTVNSVPEGTYNGARITLGEVSVKLNNNNTFTFNGSANHQVEVGINPSLEVSNGDEGDLLFDLDLSDSFDFSGSFMGNWISNIAQITGINNFEPDFRAVALDQTGSVSGQVVDANGNPVAYAYVEVKYDYNGDGVPDSVSTIAKADGTFKIIGLPQGAYELKAETENDGNATVGSVNVSVQHNTTVTVNVQ